MSIEEKIKPNIKLAPLTTFKIGGPAKFFIEIFEKNELIEAINWAEEKKQVVYFLAGGSNVLIPDKGIEGLVIRFNNDKIELKGERVEAEAGANLIKLVRLSVNNKLSGLEWAIGIPGTIGGAVRGNAGAYGEAIDKSVETLEAFNTKIKKFSIFSNRDCKFQYKNSIFKENQLLLIWQVNLKLNKGVSSDIESSINKYLEHRDKTQPKLPSAGCIFKNIEAANIRDYNSNLLNEARELGFLKGEKVGAGWIIEKCGLKGKNIGGAKISLEHANFIINTGKATAEDVITLISYIKQQVRTKYNIQLNEEIQYLGF